MKLSLPLLALVLAGFLSLFADTTPKPALPVSDYKCSVAPLDDAHLSYQATAQAEHDQEWDWKFALSVRKGKNARRRALMDCSDWMDQMDRATLLPQSSR